MEIIRPAARRAAPLVLLASFLACGGKEDQASAPSPTPGAATAAQPGEPPAVPVEIKRGNPPIPAPGESAGLQARHGGLVEMAGAHGIELVADARGAKVYLYDSSGGPATVSEASGTLTATSSGGSKTVALTLGNEAGTPVLSGSGELPAAFEARLELKLGAETHTLTLQFGAGGVPGSSRVHEEGSSSPPAP